MLSDEVRQNLAQLKTGIKGCVAISYVMTGQHLSQISLGWNKDDSLHSIALNVAYPGAEDLKNRESFAQLWDDYIVPALPTNLLTTYKADQTLKVLQTAYNNSSKGKVFDCSKFKMLDIYLYAAAYLPNLPSLGMGDIAKKLGINLANDNLHRAMQYADIALYFLNNVGQGDILDADLLLDPEYYSIQEKTAIAKNIKPTITLSATVSVKNSTGEKQASSIKIIAVIFVIAVAIFAVWNWHQSSAAEKKAQKVEYEQKIQDNGLTKKDTVMYEHIAQELLLKNVNDPDSLDISSMDVQKVKDFVFITGVASGKNAFNATVQNNYELIIQASKDAPVLFKIGNTYFVGSEATYDQIDQKIRQ